MSLRTRWDDRCENSLDYFKWVIDNGADLFKQMNALNRHAPITRATNLMAKMNEGGNSFNGEAAMIGAASGVLSFFACLAVY